MFIEPAFEGKNACYYGVRFGPKESHFQPNDYFQMFKLKNHFAGEYFWFYQDIIVTGSQRYHFLSKATHLVWKHYHRNC